MMPELRLVKEDEIEQSLAISEYAFQYKLTDEERKEKN